jgi:hypothetical protein
MMALRASWIVLATSVVLVALTGLAQAQSLDLGQRPTLSPWFGLYQRNSGPLDNYHMIVRPQIAVNDAIQRQQADIQRNTAGINYLGGEMMRPQVQGLMAPTGTASVFMNYSHYYYSGQATGGRVGVRPLTNFRTWTPPPATARGIR